MARITVENGIIFRNVINCKDCIWYVPEFQISTEQKVSNSNNSKNSDEVPSLEISGNIKTENH
jgi:Pyruvate/2-oxoacid:ferredoxin oxidoreductase delta subunit